MRSATCSPVNWAIGVATTSVVVGAGGEVVVVEGGVEVGDGAASTVSVVEVADGDRRLVPAPLHAVTATSKTHRGPKKRAESEGKRSLNTKGFPTAEINPLGRTICVPLGGRKHRV